MLVADLLCVVKFCPGNLRFGRNPWDIISSCGGSLLPHREEIWRYPGMLFGPAPNGAAIYSIISPEAEAQMYLHHNTYTANSVLLNRFGGVNYNSLEEYQKASGQDKGSTVEKGE